MVDARGGRVWLDKRILKENRTKCKCSFEQFSTRHCRSDEGGAAFFQEGDGVAEGGFEGGGARLVGLDVGDDGFLFGEGRDGNPDLVEALGVESKAGGPDALGKADDFSFECGNADEEIDVGGKESFCDSIDVVGGADDSFVAGDAHGSHPCP